VRKPPTLSSPLALAVILAALPDIAHASIFEGETLDKVANVLSWIVLFLVPIVGIAVFWLVHILPEKIAEKRNHPQATAIHVLCLLSLFFGGMLWPLAWLWAYTKPVMYRLAYGTDQGEHGGPGRAPASNEDTRAGQLEYDGTKTLRERVAELEAQQARTAPEGKKA
jgi:CBS domain containing-hemolysin-like protein